MSSHVRDLFRARVAAVSPAPYRETIGTVVDLNTIGDSWVTLEFPLVTAQRVSLGYPCCYRESGAVVVHCFARSGLGETEAMQLAEAIRPAFDVPYLSDVRLLGTSPPSLIPTDNGEWLDVVLPVAYEWDYVVQGVTP